MRRLRPLRIIKGEKGRIRRWIEKRAGRRLGIFTKDAEERQESIGATSHLRRGTRLDNPLREKVSGIRSGGGQQASGSRRRYFADKARADEFAADPHFPVTSMEGPCYDTDRNEWYVVFQPGGSITPSPDEEVSELRTVLNRLRVGMDMRDAIDVSAIVDRMGGGKETEMNDVAARILDAVVDKNRDEVAALSEELLRHVEQTALGGIYEWEIYDPYTEAVIISGIGAESGRETLSQYRYSYGSHLEIRPKGSLGKKKH